MSAHSLKALLAAGATVLITALLGTTPAYAGEAGRTCKTYYHLDNPALGGFTVCVKLVHDPVLHEWRTSSSVTTTTPGMVLHSARATMWTYNAMNNWVEVSNIGGQGPPSNSGIFGIETIGFRCHDSQRPFQGKEFGYVTWPDRTDSIVIATETPIIYGNC